MATKSKEIESLLCALCLDVYVKATLLVCGHTFCRKCLEQYHQCYSRQDDSRESSTSSSMTCPLCRKETNVADGGVASLPLNVSINHLVEEYSNSETSQLKRLYEDRPMCSQCSARDSNEGSTCADMDLLAAAFCFNCEVYLCEHCLTSHKAFERTTFAGHRVTSVGEMMSGGGLSGKQFEKCLEHKSEDREFYCADCRAIICHKCTIVKHNVRDHRIVERTQYEKDIREKIEDLVQKCETEKLGLESRIRDVEHKRQSAGQSLHEVLTSIDDTFKDLQKRLEDRKKQLKSEVMRIKFSYEGRFDSVKISAKKMSSKLSTSEDLLLCQGGRGCLEGDALVAHEHLCSDVNDLIESCRDFSKNCEGIPTTLMKTAKRLTFHLNERHRDISNIGSLSSGEKWELFKEVSLVSVHEEEPMCGLGVLSPNEVLIAYFNDQPRILSLDGNLTAIKVKDCVEDIAVLSDGRVATVRNTRLKLRAADGSLTATRFNTCKDGKPNEMMIDCDKEDDIYICYWTEKLIHVFHPTGGDPFRTIRVSSKPYQVHTTSCGSMVIRYNDSVGVLNDWDEEICRIPAPKDGEIYPAVDKNDALYIAEVDRSTSRLVIKEYTLDGVCLKTIVDIKVRIPECEWYYMKCPSPNTIVFCTAGMMYILKKELDLK